MREITDMKGVRSLAHTFLLLEPEPTDYAPVVMKHPFTDSGVVALRKRGEDIVMADIMKDPDVRRKWREQVAEQIDASESVQAIYCLLTKSYYFAFLKFARPYLSKEDLADTLAYAWTSVEAPNQDPNFGRNGLLALFKSAEPGKLMGSNEYEKFLSLDETVTVYRGVTPYNADDIESLSWTLDRKVAEWFAHRFGQEGCVYQAEISKEHIFALFTRRSEAEVIVDPKQLRQIREIENEVQEDSPEEMDEEIDLT